MKHDKRYAKRVRSYAIAILGSFIAAMLRYELGPVLGDAIPVVIFTVPVVISALYGGFWPGLLCTAISALISEYLFMEPYGTFTVTEKGAVILTVFVVVGLAISFFGQKMMTLQATLRQQSEKLEQMNLDLVGAHSRKDEFLAILAHELRNPLAAISTAAELLKFARVDQRRMTQTGEVISRQVRHMTKLVDELLDLSRVTRGLIVIDKKPVEVKEALQQAVEQVRSAIELKQQQLRLEMPDDDIYVFGDRVRLVQVISNLLTNANRYSPPASMITARVNSTNDDVGIVVEDNGNGISSEVLPKIFDLFVQAERTADSPQEGLGIGLALVSNIVKLHSGSVEAYSGGLGRGSRFTIKLPRINNFSASLQPELSAKSPPFRSVQILLVDDNRDAADSTAKLLEAFGHAVFVEYSAKGALERAHSEQFDVIILDIGLPDKNGLEVCAMMRRIPHMRESLFIALSGYGQQDDLTRSAEAGFHRHLTKPVSIDDLLKAVGTRDVSKLS